jgi:hypothetical protein
MYMVFDFSQIGKELTNPFVYFWNAAVQYLPGIVAAIIILIIGYLIAMVVGFVIRKIVEHTKLDDFLVKKKIEKPHVLGGARLSSIIGRLLKWWVFIIFLTPAANVIKLGSLADILTKLALWLPHLIAAVVIMVVGLLVAEFLANIPLHAKQLEGMKAVAVAIKVVVLVFFALISLREIGINIVLAETTLMMLIGGIILIFVIGFGVGLVKPAQALIEGWMKKIK